MASRASVNRSVPDPGLPPSPEGNFPHTVVKNCRGVMASPICLHPNPFQSGCTILLSYQQEIILSFAVHPCQHLECPLYFYFSHSDRCLEAVKVISASKEAVIPVVLSYMSWAAAASGSKDIGVCWSTLSPGALQVSWQREGGQVGPCRGSVAAQKWHSPCTLTSCSHSKSTTEPNVTGAVRRSPG